MLVLIDDRFAFLSLSPEFHQGDNDLAQLLFHALVAEYTVPPAGDAPSPRRRIESRPVQRLFPQEDLPGVRSGVQW